MSLSVPVVYFGNDWFGESRTSSHHIARRLAKRVPLLYVDSPGFRAPTASARDFKKIQRKLKETFERPQRIDLGGGHAMWHIVAPQIPFRGLPLVKGFNYGFGAHLVRKALRFAGFREYMSWFATPDMANLAGRLGERFTVYYITDDHKSMPGVNGREIAALDDMLTRKADQVFVTSPIMETDKKKVNPTAQYSPHGVDVEMFQQALSPDCPIPEAARGLRKPVVGFWGTVDTWVHTDLIADLARLRPEWTFLIIGKINDGREKMGRQPNVVMTGPQPYLTLPGWAKAIDAAIIPFRDSELVSHINPLKLREYLATGKPVVSTPMPEVTKLGDCVHVGSGTEDFLRKLDQAVLNDTEEHKMLRLKTVASMTWEARVDAVLEVIERRWESKYA